jgi:purine-binding chemotaxis protein CheW
MSAADEAQYVTFGLGEEVFAAPVSMVREILDYREPFKIPNGPPYLLGLTDVRGRGVPTADLRVRLGLTPAVPTTNTRILVMDVEVAGRVLSLGFVADRVFEVTPFRAADIEAAPDIGIPWRSEYIAGVVRRSEGFVVVIDLGRLLSSEEAAVLDQASMERAA